MSSLKWFPLGAVCGIKTPLRFAVLKPTTVTKKNHFQFRGEKGCSSRSPHSAEENAPGWSECHRFGFQTPALISASIGVVLLISSEHQAPPCPPGEGDWSQGVAVRPGWKRKDKGSQSHDEGRTQCALPINWNSANQSLTLSNSHPPVLCQHFSPGKAHSFEGCSG